MYDMYDIHKSPTVMGTPVNFLFFITGEHHLTYFLEKNLNLQ